MINVMMGGIWKERYWSYYETVGGGTGGRPNGPGVSGVHVNMTNTLNTPIEIAEREFPLRFTAYKIREGGGGAGRHPGGDGIVRAFKVMAFTTQSIIAFRFKIGPWGLEGGGSGKPAKVTIYRKDGVTEFVENATVSLEEGDKVVIETPEGGGYGQ